MLATALWSVLLVAGVLLEVSVGFAQSGVYLNRAVAMIERRVSGRVVLILLWALVGFHLFARYTIPHS